MLMAAVGEALTGKDVYITAPFWKETERIFNIVKSIVHSLGIRAKINSDIIIILDMEDKEISKIRRVYPDMIDQKMRGTGGATLYIDPCQNWLRNLFIGTDFSGLELMHYAKKVRQVQDWYEVKA